MPNDDLKSRVTSLEHEVVRLREQVAFTSADAAAARLLAAGADRDVSEVRAELRAHTQGLNALRETLLEQGQELTILRHDLVAQDQKLTGLRQEMREGFGTLATGIAEITTLLTKIAEAEHSG